MKDEYMVQAILIDGQIERVIHSIKTTDYQAALDTLMKLHRNSYHYLYIAMAIENQEIVFKSNKNKFAW